MSFKKDFYGLIIQLRVNFQLIRQVKFICSKHNLKFDKPRMICKYSSHALISNAI